MKIAIEKLLKNKVIRQDPISEQVIAISCGILNGEVILDLDYKEDSQAQVDANFVMTAKGKLIEVQSTAEGHPFSTDQFQEMMALALESVKELSELQLKSLV